MTQREPRDGRRRQSPKRPVLLVGVMVVLFGGCAWGTRASLSATGYAANGVSWRPSMSADGRFVAFSSRASNLIPTDGNRREDVFVRDLASGRTRRASVDIGGGGPNGVSTTPSISADGSLVAFGSTASDLVAGDGNGVADVFVRDLVAGTTTRVSVDPTGADPDGASTAPSISGDGRYVAFTSLAADLVAGDGNAQSDVFVRDLQLGTTTRVSVDTDGGDGDGTSREASMSADGRHVAFMSFAADLVPGGNGSGGVYVRDLSAGTTTLASVNRFGVPTANSRSWEPSISGDGRFVAFSSIDDDLVPDDHNQITDVFVRDLRSASTTRASVDIAGGDPDSFSFSPSISANGRIVAFDSQSSDLVPGDQAGGTADVFVRDLAAGTTALMSPDPIGGPGRISGLVSISGDGRYVASESRPNMLSATDAQVDVRFVVIPTVTALAPVSVARGATATLHLTGTGFLPGARAVVSFGVAGMTVDSTVVQSSTDADVTVTVAGDAAGGPRDLTIVDPGTGPGPATGSAGLCAACLAVT